MIASVAQSFMVLEKMGTKKRYVYNLGQTIEYQLKGHKSLERTVLTDVLDSAFISYSDTISFSSINKVNIGAKRESGIVSSAGPVLISAGLVLIGIDYINRGLIQEGGYTWDPAIGTTSVILATTGVLIMVLKKDTKKIGSKSWWRLRKTEIY